MGRTRAVLVVASVVLAALIAAGWAQQPAPPAPHGDDVLVDVRDQPRDDGGIARGPDPSGYAGQLARAERLQDTWSWLTPALAAITFLGDEEFYLLCFPPLYWAVSRRWGIRLGGMLLLSAGINGVLKLAFTTPRPGFLDPALARVEEHSFGLPSGHAQNAAAAWGLMATGVGRRWLQATLVVLIAAIGWSRVHLGAHMLEDVLVGWTVGALLVVVVVRSERRVVAWWRRIGDTDRVLAAVTGSLMMVAPAVLLAGRLRGVSFTWPGLPEVSEVAGASAVVTPAGTLAGLLIGLAVLARGGGFEVGGPLGGRVLRVLAGTAVLLVVWQGLGAVFPDGEGPLALALRYLRYALVGVWVGGLGPLTFVRLGLAPPGDRVAPEHGR